MQGSIKRSITVLSLSLAAIAGSTTSLAQSGGHRSSINPPPQDDVLDGFRYYFSVTTDPQERKNGNHWSDQLSFDTEVLSRDFVILYSHDAGNYPVQGPHIAQAPGYLEAHLLELTADVERQIPDPEFSGVAIIDYEDFRAIWDRTPNSPSSGGPEAHDEDFQDDWRDYIRSVNPQFDGMNSNQQEQHLRETYEAAIRDFFLATLAKCRELRPNAKWGFYGYPLRFYKWRREAPTSVISYDDGSHAGSRFNDRLQWMWDAVDVVSPSVYPAMVVPNDGEEICSREYSAEEEWIYLQNMIRESQRVGGGKPVLPFITGRFYLPKDCLAGQEIRPIQIYNQVLGPARHGAQGAILWGDINSRSQAMEWQAALDNSFLPLMASAIQERQDGGDPSSGDEGDHSAGGAWSQGGSSGSSGAFGGSGGKVATKRGGPGPRAFGVSGEEARRAVQRATRHLQPVRSPRQERE